MLEKVIKDASLQYLTDSQGRRTAVVMDIRTWNKLLEALEDEEDAEEMRSARDEEDEQIPWQQVVAEYRAEHPDAQI
jgi:hypothetical protein